MGSQSKRQRTIERKRTDQLGQSSRPIAQANEDRLRLQRQRYAEEQAERRASSSSQHVASGSQRRIKRKIIEMMDKLKSLSGESVEVERASPKLVDLRDSFFTDCQASPEAPESCHSPR
ncbi:hypothetical protein R1sor_003800 [Riccia sorocarpa]|uniref:Uncharacterized protein n=1 Tax=Riccia sorocarpa TaxID=122646 RepID=A0ABD3H3F7_9MARC